MPDAIIDWAPHMAAATPAMVELRHDIHRHPELAFTEVRTTEVIVNRLRQIGWSIERCPTTTGAVARWSTGRPGRTVMLRADIDALPVEEERDLEFRSTEPGLMHACGHDVHTAALLGAAEMIRSASDQLVGTFFAVFQPAEEGIGGARAMVEGGLLTDYGIERAVGCHVSSLAPLGVVALKPGVLMSEARAFTVTLRGRGGHGAMASTAGNVVLAIAQIALAVPDIVAGLSFEETACAASAGVVSAGTAPNVVPRTATLRGTVRTFTEEQSLLARERLRTLIDEVAATYAVEPTLKFDSLAPAVKNDPDATVAVEAAAKSVPGIEAVLRIGPATPSEDVSEFLNRVPGCFCFVGGALPDGSSGMHHSPDFAVDDAAVPLVAGVLAAGAAALAQP